MADQGSSRLFRMLADLAERPELLERFTDEETRTSVFEEYGLTDEQIELLEKAMDESRHDHERYGHMTKLFEDEALATIRIPLC